MQRTFAGPEHCQAKCENKINFRVNALLATVSLAIPPDNFSHTERLT
jgi:hypothetical protein